MELELKTWLQDMTVPSRKYMAFSQRKEILMTL
jgi:hypothetical protein